MADLHADAGVAVAVHEVHDAGESARLLVIPQAGASRVMRASGETQVISTITRPAPPMARPPRCTKWKSPGTPSWQEYMAMGETMMRFLSRTPRAW